jgi:hypothetical protein
MVLILTKQNCLKQQTGIMVVASKTTVDIDLLHKIHNILAASKISSVKDSWQVKVNKAISVLVHALANNNGAKRHSNIQRKFFWKEVYNIHLSLRRISGSSWADCRASRGGSMSRASRKTTRKTTTSPDIWGCYQL